MFVVREGHLEQQRATTHLRGVATSPRLHLADVLLSSSCHGIPTVDYLTSGHHTSFGSSCLWWFLRLCWFWSPCYSKIFFFWCFFSWGCGYWKEDYTIPLWECGIESNLSYLAKVVLSVFFLLSSNFPLSLSLFPYIILSLNFITFLFVCIGACMCMCAHVKVTRQPEVLVFFLHHGLCVHHCLCTHPIHVLEYVSILWLCKMLPAHLTYSLPHSDRRK